MSAANNRSRAPASASALKKFCKVCQDAGKSEKEYTSHFVRSAPGPNGVVVCPTLLSQECRYCYGRGHTVKFCTVLEKNKKTEAFVATSNQKKVVAKEKQVKPANAFDALYASDNDEEEELVSKVSNTTNIVDKFPVLGAVKKEPLVKANAFSYAAALATEVKPKPVVPIIATPVIITAPVKTWTTWADCESSSDEDEDEEEKVVQKTLVYEDNSAW